MSKCHVCAQFIYWIHNKTKGWEWDLLSHEGQEIGTFIIFTSAENNVCCRLTSDGLGEREKVRLSKYHYAGQKKNQREEEYWKRRHRERRKEENWKGKGFERRLDAAPLSDTGAECKTCTGQICPNLVFVFLNCIWTSIWLTFTRKMIPNCNAITVITVTMFCL